jgi:ribonuclease-3
MTRKAPDLAALSARLGHDFADPDLLREALTHPSAQQGARASARNYQRLEFLGDRVLALAIAEMLFETFPSESEGALSRRLTQLVRAETCAEVAVDLDLGPHLILGEGEHQSGGRRKVPILGDVCEAVIGAVFRDGGFLPARALVRRLWAERMHAAADDLRDPKTTLQEWAQARGLPTPTYATVARTGPDHAPRFVMAVEVKGLGRAEGEGASKRLAEQAAATAFLDHHASGARAHG